VLIVLLVWMCVAFARPESETLMYAGRVGDALTAAQGEAAAAPHDMDAQERWIDLQLNLRLFGRALGYAKARQVDAPEDPNAHYLVGRADMNTVAAQKAYENALRIDPDHARSHMGIAALHLGHGRMPQAEAGYRNALQRDSTLTEASQGLARILAAHGRVDEALVIAQKAAKDVPDGPDAYITIAILEPVGARATLLQGIAAAGDDPRLHARLADVYLLDNQPELAFKAAQRAIAIDPRRADAALAAMYATDLVEGNLTHDGYLTMLRTTDRETDPAAAMRSYSDVVDRHPGCAIAWMARSRMRRQLGDAAGALSDLESAALTSPDNAEVGAAYGLALLEAGRHAEAANVLMATTAKRPLDPSLSIALSRAQWGANQQSVAIAVLQRAYTKFPYDVRVSLEYAKALSDNGETLAAYRVVRESAERVPDQRLTLALIAAARDAGRYREAADILQAIGEQNNSPKLIEAANELRALQVSSP
jgi:predicted Zn-dependent protease